MLKVLESYREGLCERSAVEYVRMEGSARFKQSNTITPMKPEAVTAYRPVYSL